MRVIPAAALLLLFLACFARAQSSTYSVTNMATPDDSTFSGSVGMGSDFSCSDWEPCPGMGSSSTGPSSYCCFGYTSIDGSGISAGTSTPGASIYNQFKENTHFGNPPENQVSRFQGTFQIPDDPYSNNGEVLFVMMGMKQNDDPVYQEKPLAGVVAMYNQGSADTQTLGRSGAWTVYSWFQKSGSNGIIVVSYGDTSVTAGAHINVDILYTEDNSGTVSISSQSSTGGSTSLRVQNVVQGFNIIQDLLSTWYATSDCNNYMPASAISFWSLSAYACNQDDCTTSTDVSSSLSWTYADPGGSVCGNNMNAGSSSWHNLGPYSV